MVCGSGLTEARAVVVRLSAREWLRVRPRDIRSALALGHRAGHLHWTVVVEPDSLAATAPGRWITHPPSAAAHKVEGHAGARRMKI